MQNGTLLVFIGLYLLGTLAIGWWASRRVKTTADFVVAGKKLPLFMASCALFATWFGSETVMGASSEFAQHGLLGVIEDPFGASLCLLLVGLLIARPLYSLNLFTFNDFFRIRFNRAAEVTSAVFMVPSYFSWIAAQLVALAIILQAICGLDREWGVLLCTSMVLIYTYIGGMWSVTITDFVQTIAIVIGLLALAIDMLWQVGGPAKVVAAAPEGFFQFFPEGKPVEMIHWLAAWMTIGLGSIPQQDVFQRVMAAKSERTSILACYTSSLMYLSIAFLPLIIAFCGRMLYPELVESDAQMMIPAMVLQHGSIGMQILFFGALLSAILSTCSGAMLAPATVVGENLVRPMFKSLTDEQLLRIMRWSVVAVAIVTGAMALMRNNIYELVGESSALSLVSLFTPLIAGLYWRRASATGAIVSMISGMGVWLLTLVLLPEEPAEDASIWLHIPPMLYGFAAGIAGMAVGSWWRPNRTTDAVASDM
ncbi:MAG: sodium:solute symporter family protein [Lewinellaceae bacterium]|nr:sodium:solute symporter family protein [Saprospiraceae bacterium]MCB9307454.1 sodium:solute symporter family protein [Lewinellaceae bacterium]